MVVALPSSRQMASAAAAPSGRVQPVYSAPLPRFSRRAVHVVRAQASDPDTELEERLAKLRKAKGATPYGEGVKAGDKKAVKKPEDDKPAAAAKPAYDWSNESVHYEGPPHRGDLVTNLVMGATLAWLPLTFAAVGRAIYVTYRFTDKRMSVTTVTPFKSEQTDIAYQEVKDVVIVGRGVGLWGDMVVTLKDGSKVELRALDKYKELRDYVVARRDELAPAEAPAGSSKGAASTPRGKVVTQEELMSGADAKKGKGFS